MKSASQRAFQSLPDVSTAVSELTVLKGVGPATASAVLAAYAPDVAPFMSDEVIYLYFFTGRFHFLMFLWLEWLIFLLCCNVDEGYGGCTWEFQRVYVEEVSRIC